MKTSGISEIINRYVFFCEKQSEIYDEMKLLEISGGKCAQDALCIVPLNTLPEYVEERMKHNISEAVMCDNRRILCFFRDNSSMLLDLKKMLP